MKHMNDTVSQYFSSTTEKEWKIIWMFRFCQNETFQLRVNDLFCLHWKCWHFQVLFVIHMKTNVKIAQCLVKWNFCSLSQLLGEMRYEVWEDELVFMSVQSQLSTFKKSFSYVQSGWQLLVNSSCNVEICLLQREDTVFSAISGNSAGFEFSMATYKPKLVFQYQLQKPIHSLCSP